MHPPISEVRLLPRHVPFFCHQCKSHKATVWLVCPEGRAILTLCEAHAQANIKEMREKIGEEWTAAPIHHDLPDSVHIARA